MRVLVVEDDPDLNHQLCSALGRAGYVVEAARDGEQGHFLADTSDFDAVILDLGLPVMKGIEVLRKWRDAGRTMPVLILTADDLWSNKVVVIDAGADDYLAKPFHMAEVLARVRALIRRRNGFADAILVSGELQMDTRSGAVTRGGAPHMAILWTAGNIEPSELCGGQRPAAIGEIAAKQAEALEHVAANRYLLVTCGTTDLLKKLMAGLLVRAQRFQVSPEEGVKARVR